MLCPNCRNSLPDGAKYCNLCRTEMPVYTAPDGFSYDSSCNRYYRSEPGWDQAGAPVNWVTWFNAVTGEYQQVSYPAQQPEPQAAPAPEPEAPLAPALPPEPVSNAPATPPPPEAPAPQAEELAGALLTEPMGGSDPAPPPEPAPTLNIPPEAIEPAPEPQPQPELTAAPQSPAPAPETPPVEPRPAPPPPPEATAPPPPPAGYAFDPNRGLYYQSVIGTDPQTGAPVQLVTYYNPATGEYTRESYPLPQPEPPPAPPTEEAPTATKPPLANPPPGGKKKLIAAAAVVVVLAGLAFTTWKLEWYRSLPFFSSSSSAGELEPHAMPGGVETGTLEENDLPTFAPYDAAAVEDDTAEQEATREEEERQQREQEAAEAREREVAQLSTGSGQWYDFPHSSRFYMRVQEDEQHIYMLQPTLDDYYRGNLYRMDKDGSNIQKINRFANGSYELTGFTLLDDMIYFGISVDPGDFGGRSAYYRVPKSGGNAEFLFIQEASYMQSYEGSIYLMFPTQLSLGVYTPGSDRLPRLIQLVDWEESELGAPPAYLSGSFGLYDGWLYYGDSWELACTHYRTSLDTREIQLLSSDAMLGQSLVMDVVYDGDMAYYCQLDFDQGTGEEAFHLRRTRLNSGERSESFCDTPPENAGQFETAPVIARAGNCWIYQSGARYMVAPLDDIYNAEELFATYATPYGISRDWFFFIGEIYNLDTGERIDLNRAANGPEIRVADEHNRALELAARYVNEWGIQP